MSLALKPTHATVKAYYETLGQFGQLHIDHEMAVRSAFQDLLAKSGRKAKPPLTLVPEYRIELSMTGVLRAAKCIGPFGRLRAGSSSGVLRFRG